MGRSELAGELVAGALCQIGREIVDSDGRDEIVGAGRRITTRVEATVTTATAD